MSTPLDGPPRWLIGAKVLLAGLLLCGALLPEIGGFAGKGMAYRLPLFLAPALIVPVRWWRQRPRSRYPTALDAALTLPFLFDTAANAVGLYDHLERTDDVLHVLNWCVLVGGIALTLDGAVRETTTPRWMTWVAATGIGAAAIIGWETAEYAVMRAGVGGLSLTYGDTLADLVLSTTGGAAGGLLALRRWGLVGSARPASGSSA